MNHKRKTGKSTAKTGLQKPEISLLTKGHEDMLRSFLNGWITLGLGYAGTGKTFMAVMMALSEVFRPESEFNKILFLRSTVPVRDNGFLPGTEQEKQAPYARPFMGIVNEIMGRGDAYSILESHGVLEFRSTSFEQGLTYKNTIVIVDEAENLTFKELDLITTRLGENTKLIVVGDLNQDYVTKKGEKTGLPEYIEVMEEMIDDGHSVDIIWFKADDIVRNELIKGYILAKARVQEAA